MNKTAVVLMFVLTGYFPFNLIAQPLVASSITFKTDTVKDLQLTEEQKADFKDKALRKTKAFSNYISIASDKSKKEIQKNKAIDLAVKLFMNDSNMIEVSSLYNPTKRYKIRAYLNKLKLLPYVIVKVSWYDIFFASDFVRRPDGRYEAVATIYQRFEGVNNEFGHYIDITKKNIKIIIEQREILTGDITELKWEVFLGDIKVEETKFGK